MAKRGAGTGVLRIDGAYGEGGGQVLRTSLSLSALLSRPFEIVHIRSNRERRGLQPQHCAAVVAAAELCDAEVSGVAVGSERVRFSPRVTVQPGRYEFDLNDVGHSGHPGAVTLILQTVIVPLLCAAAPSSVAVRGATHLPLSPAAEYLDRVYIAALRRAGGAVSVQQVSAGFRPQGGGEMRCVVTPAPLTPLRFDDRGALTKVMVIGLTAGLPDVVAERAVGAASASLRAVVMRAETLILRPQSLGRGCALTVVAECEGGLAGFTSIGDGVLAEGQIAEDAVQQFANWMTSGAAVDEYLADQLVLPMLFAGGWSVWRSPRVTEHLRTVVWLANQFLPDRARIEGSVGEPGTIVVRGEPYTPRL